MKNETIVVFDPTPQRKTNRKTKGSKSPKHALDLKGKRLAVVWNRKLGGDILLNRFAELLTDRLGLAGVEQVNERGDSGRSLGENIIARLVSQCDAAIVGTGD
jgi:hypothetical protein